jgi:hypothetical protein
MRLGHCLGTAIRPIGAPALRASLTLCVLTLACGPVTGAAAASPVTLVAAGRRGCIAGNSGRGRRHRLRAGKRLDGDDLSTERHGIADSKPQPDGRRRPRRRAVRKRYGGGVQRRLRYLLGGVSVAHPARARQPRVRHPWGRGLLRLLRRGRRRPLTGLLLLRPRRLARPGPELELRIRLVRCRIGAGAVGSGRPCRTPGRVHSGLLAPPAVHLGAECRWC